MSGTKGHSGRKPTPTTLSYCTATPGKRPLNDDEPKPQPRLARAPAHLSEAAKKEWQRAGRFLLQLGLISDLDLAAFRRLLRRVGTLDRGRRGAQNLRADAQVA